MKKDIKDYLPVKPTELTFIQCKISKELRDKVNKIREMKNLTWTDVLVSCLRKFVDEFADELGKNKQK